MAIYTVIPAKRPTAGVSPVLPEPVPAIDEPGRRQSPADPVHTTRANGRHADPGRHEDPGRVPR